MKRELIGPNGVMCVFFIGLFATMIAIIKS